ncbi:phosphoribosylglycinamide formyltransferase [Neobacillus sp. D3-1R]|uniref:phosphoribosylglycinamide formyltransferase n=1 Tax=Neobacillus sp. D3-1R TaxID=3445778 RepID=UPI003FA18B46
MIKIAIFASGSGSNFQAIIDNIQSGSLEAEVALLVCDRPGAFVTERAKQHSIPALSIAPKNYPSKVEYEESILKELQEKEVEFIVLAGYMRLIGSTLLKVYEGKIVNIHPSLLPAFPGKDAIGQAIAANVKISGVTVHYVDAGMDTGPIIEQATVFLSENETTESLQKKIHEVEHQLYPTVLQHLFNKLEEKKDEQKASTY